MNSTMPSGPAPLKAGGLRELASLLASADPVDHLVGLGRVRAMDGGRRLPVLMHVLRTCDRAIRPHLMEQIREYGPRDVRKALEQLLASDSVHPLSAVHYLAAVRQSGHNGLILDWLPRSAEEVQAGLLEVLRHTAGAAAYRRLGELSDSLPPASAALAGHLLASRKARKLLERAASPPPIRNLRPPVAIVPTVRLFGAAVRHLPSREEMLAWIASGLLVSPLIWSGRPPATPLEALSLLAFFVATSRCLTGLPALGERSPGQDRR